MQPLSTRWALRTEMVCKTNQVYIFYKHSSYWYSKSLKCLPQTNPNMHINTTNTTKSQNPKIHIWNHSPTKYRQWRPSSSTVMFPRWRSIPAQAQTHTSQYGGRGGSGTEMCYLYFHTSWRGGGGGGGGKQCVTCISQTLSTAKQSESFVSFTLESLCSHPKCKQIKWKWHPSMNGTQPAEPAYCISDCASHHPQRWEAEHTIQPQSQHTNSSKNTKDTLKCCHTLHSLCGGLSSAIVNLLHSSTQPP